MEQQTRQKTRPARAGQHDTGRRAQGRGRGRRAPQLMGALLIGLAILGGAVWVATQQAAPAGTGAGAASGQPVPSRSLALPSTHGGALSLQQLAGRTVVLYFYEEST